MSAETLTRGQLRRAKWAEQGGACCYCGCLTVLDRANRARPPNLATLDHVVPRSRGGATDADNTVLACLTCNDRKANKSPAFAVSAYRLLGKRVPASFIREPAPPAPRPRHVPRHHANPGPVRPLHAEPKL